jgi:hypothetical protein
LSDFKETSIFTNFLKNTQTSNLMKIRPVRAEAFHAGRRTYGQADMTKSISRYSQFCERAKNSTDIWALQDKGKIRTDAAKIKSFRSWAGY